MGVVGGGRLTAGGGKVAGRACPSPTGGGGWLAGAGREVRGRDESLPYGVRGTGDCRAACPQAAAGVYGCEGGFGLSL